MTRTAINTAKWAVEQEMKRMREQRDKFSGFISPDIFTEALARLEKAHLELSMQVPV